MPRQSSTSIVRSMTGFAKVVGSLGHVDVDVEIRSVNSRYLEVSVKGLQRVGALERDVRGIVQKLHVRGRLDVVINRRVTAVDETGISGSNETDTLVSKYLTMCKRYGATSDGLSGFLASLVMRESAGSYESTELSEQEVTLIKDLAEQASVALAHSRSLEGAALVADMQRRVVAIAEVKQAIERQMSGAALRFKERLLERISQLAPEVRADPDRLALEVALLADRVDVSEELARLQIHVAEFSSTLSRGGADGVGRKLDFLVQEIGRELNTIGSKAQDAIVQGLVVESKAELERIREQVQNIE